MYAKILRRLLLSLGLGCMILVPQQAAAQVKIGVMNFTKALEDTAEIKKAGEDLQKRFKPRYDELDQLSKDLAAIQQKIQTAGNSDVSQLQVDGQRKQRRAQRLNEDVQTDFEFERNEILQSASLKMREVINKLAAEKGLDLVLDVANTLYVSAALNVTADATSAYDKTHPVAAP